MIVGFLLVPILTLLAILANLSIISYNFIYVSLGLLVFLNIFIGDREFKKTKINTQFYFFCVYLSFIGSFVLVLSQFILASHETLDWHNWYIFVLNGAILAMCSFAPSHELIHKDEKIHRVCGQLGFTLIAIMASALDHIRIHHNKWGKSEDSTYHPKNQKFWFGFLNSMIAQEKARTKFKKEIRTLDVIFISFISILVLTGAIRFASVYLFSLVVVRIFVEIINHISHLNADGVSGKSCQSLKLIERFLFFGANLHGMHHKKRKLVGYLLTSNTDDHTFWFGYLWEIFRAIVFLN